MCCCKPSKKLGTWSTGCVLSLVAGDGHMFDSICAHGHHQFGVIRGYLCSQVTFMTIGYSNKTLVIAVHEASEADPDCCSASWARYVPRVVASNCPLDPTSSSPGPTGHSIGSEATKSSRSIRFPPCHAVPSLDWPVPEAACGVLRDGLAARSVSQVALLS